MISPGSHGQSLEAPGITTLNQLFYLVIERNSERAVQYRDPCDKRWVPIPARELYRHTIAISRELRGWGIAKGDRVAILSENRPEWAVADFAALLQGAASVPVYPTLTPPQTAFILKESGARILFVSTEALLKKCLGIAAQTDLEKIVLMDKLRTPVPGHPPVFAMKDLMAAGPAQRDPEFDRTAQSVVVSSDMATIIYTSGTTGNPKGAVLSHENLTVNCRTAACITGWPLDAPAISYLPLSHVTARHVDYCCFLLGITLAYCGGFDQLPRALQEIRPKAFVAVPRIYEKVRSDIKGRFQRSKTSGLVEWSQKVGLSHRAGIMAGSPPRSFSFWLARLLVFNRVRAALGGRVQVLNSGGAPLGEELAGWYANCGLPIFEGYGLTETSPVIALNIPGACKVGSVGRPLKNVECRIAEDGEILVRGPSIFQGYWQRPQETLEAFRDGWFKTGDIGRLDEDGFLFITDRKKDLIKTSGGKFVAPQPIELMLKSNALVSQAVVLGDRRKFVAVLIVPNHPMLEEWARQEGISFTSREELLAKDEVRQLYDGIVAGINQRLASFETVKKVILVSRDFSTASGEMTASMKVRRREVEKNYQSQIDALYD